MDKSFIDLFEEQVLKTPGNIAVVFEQEQLSYQELNERSNMLAYYLRSIGVKEETLVPLYIERGIDMMVGMLGIMKAGAAYVPIDVDFPQERINYMLHDTGASIIVSSKISRARLTCPAEIVMVEIKTVSDQPKNNLPTKVQPGQLAYVIYTSGSTGTPKGVMIEHGSLVDYITGLIEKIQINECRSFALVSTIATDLGNTVIYGSLVSGGALHLFSKEAVSNIELLHGYFAAHKIECLKIVPSHWKALGTDNKFLLPEKLLIFGGEALQEKIVKDIWSTGTSCRVVNHYGPTETTIGKLLHIIESGTKYEYTIPVGKPFSNTKVLVLTKNLKLCPIGVPGQLFIAGDGVARGYLNNPELTKEKFIQNPFSKQPGAVMYSTGDQVKYLPGGNISFIGRVDNQVKIRGYRIELGEIENHLQQCGIVSQAVVLAREDKQGNQRLVGYIIAKQAFDREGILSYLKDKLPDYMIPTVLMELESLPLTANGKVDRKALPDPDTSGLLADQYIAPRNEVEAKLAILWQDVLEVDQVGIDDDFFELGGHSLLAVRLVSSIRKAFVVEMPIGDIFDHPTVGRLAVQIANQSPSTVLPGVEKTDPRPERMPLSFSQERLWFIDQLGGSLQYHVPAVLRLSGNLNKNALAFALQNTVNRHEVLRTVFREEEGKPYQSIMEPEGWKLQVIDGKKYVDDSAGLQKYIEQLVNEPFSLSSDYMLRAALIGLEEEDNILVVTLHHIASDGWSRSILVNDFTTFYRAYEEGRPANLPVLKVQYADYSLWQRRYLEGEVLERKMAYWKKKLEGVSALQLPVDYPRPAMQSTRGALAGFSIDKALSVSLQALGQQQGATLFMTLLAAIKVLLYRYTGQQDICIGTPIAGRQQQELEGLIGFFVNTLALRTELSGEKCFTELLKMVRAGTLEAYEHQEVPFEKVVDAVVKERDMSRSPLFQLMFVLRNTPEVPELVMKEVSFSRVQYQHNTALFEMTFFITENESGLQGALEYNTDLFSEATIHRMLAHFTQLLHAIVKAPQKRIGELPMLSSAEMQKLMVDFNDTGKAYPQNRTIIDLFQQQVLSTPEAIAVIFEEEQLSYKELNERSNQLASYLQGKGVKAETLVPVCIERGLGMIVGILAILKAGGAYVPIDPDYPEERITYMLQDTAAELVLTSKASHAKLIGADSFATIVLDLDWHQICLQPLCNLQTVVSPTQLAYVIYTSGSTGKPKGVMIEHNNVFSFIKWCGEEFNSSSFEVAYAVTSVCFDLSVFEIFYPLSIGKCIRIIENGLLIGKYLGTDQQVLINSVPAVIGNLLKEGISLNNVSVLNMAGEPIPLEVQQGLDKERIEVRNLYGPTEDTTYSTVFRLRKDEPVYIGKPIANTRIYIVNKEGLLVPSGVTGEICIAGDGVARGYLNRADLTKEKFVADTFSNIPGSRLYKTGDLGRWLPDGNIEYLGRIDAQVKIRGYRIELAEIETVLQNSGLVHQSVVLARESKEGTKRLISYVVPGKEYTREASTAYLRRSLPEFMIPQLWVELDHFPLTPNGKIDKKALPDVDANELVSNDYVAPRNDLEKNLAGTWQKLLGIDRAGIHDNFFELGGDSILTIQVVSRMRRLGYEMQPKDIFIHQTINRLSAAIAERSNLLNTAEQGPLTGFSGLLPIQQWYLEKNPAEISHFNQAVLFRSDKSVTGETLKQAIAQLTAQHDALRFRYTNINGIWHQEYGSSSGIVVTEELESAPTESLGALIKEISGNHQRMLDIEKGQLVRVVLFKTPATESHNRLLVAIHHLAVDGVSWRILLEDLDVLLNAFSKGQPVALGPKSTSYRQWYQALEQYGQSKKLLSQKGYWENTIQSYVPLPVDKDHPGKKVKAGDVGQYSSKLNAELTKRLLQEVPRAYHTEINDILLCALAGTLCKWSGNNKVVIGLEGHGREAIAEDMDISRTMGWFTSLYPLLLETALVKGEGEQIKSTKEQLRRVPDRGLGYGVMKYINREATLQTGSGWDIIFNYLGQLDNVVNESKWLKGAGESAGASISEAYETSEKLSVNGYVKSGELVLTWSYSTLHYEMATIAGLASSYMARLEGLITHCVAQQKSGQVYTPSDYGLGADINYTELDNFLDEPLNGKKRKENIEGIYHLSGLQQGMLFHGLYDVEAGVYLDQFRCDLVNVDLELFKLSWDYVLKGHSILRSAFYLDTFSIPVQCAYSRVQLPIEKLDYRRLDKAEQSAALKEYAEADRIKGFDFKVPPLMRLALIRLTEDRYHMLWSWHHVLLDGWSFPILKEEFLTTYELLSSGKKPVVKEQDRYEDFIRHIERVDKEKEEAYWRNYMNGVEQSTLLPFIGKTLERTKGVGESKVMYLQLDETVTAKIQNFAQQQHVTANTIMQGVWAYLLHRYTGNSDIAFGIIVSGRPDDLPGVEQRVGMYINTMPLRTKISKERGIVEWLREIQDEQVSSRQYQHTPFNNIQSWSGVKGDLFDSIFVFQNFPISKVIATNTWKLSVENTYMHAQNNLPLTITASAVDQISIEFRYNTGLLEESNVREIMGHFEEALHQVINYPAGNISDIEMLTQKEQQELLIAFNHSQVAYPHSSIVDLFEQQAEKTPRNVAVVFEAQQLTYQQLNDRANQLASYLKTRGVKEEILVPMCIERGLDMMVAMLGILKTGGAYVPVDIDFPRDRIHYMLADTGSSILLSSKESRSKLDLGEEIEIIEIEGDWSSGNEYSNANQPLSISPHHLAYVIYTSGSTGKPKGVMIEHRNLVDYVAGLKQKIQIHDCRSFALVSTIATDLGNTVIYASLLSGGTLHILSKDAVSDADLMHRYFKKHSIDCLKIVPSHWQALSVEGKLLLPAQLLVFGGEALQAGSIEDIRLSGTNCRIVNHYGPTETTIGKLLHIVDPASKYSHTIPIGKPFSNTQVYILTKDLKLCPVGVPGQLYIAGEGVARGYHNNPDLTNEKFLSNPFTPGSRSKMYRTGDLVKYLPGGNIEFIGRVDDQVKIRGYRIELGEIESVLQQSELVKQAVVLAREDKPGNKRLVGYIVPDGVFEREYILAELREKLPEYMIPLLLVELESMPLTPNGKIDRKALPDPDAGVLLNGEYVAPRNETEEKLASIWRTVLDVDQVGIYDDFFELGGHSLLAVRLVSAIRNAMQMDLPLNDVFIFPTIATMADSFIANTQASVQPEVKFKFLVPVKNGGNKIPLYIVCGGGGTARRFKKFTDLLDDDQPVYALQPIIDNMEMEEAGYSMEEIAGKFIQEILIDNPQGPYALSGHCVGGIIAFEMAKQLEARGKKVHFLAMFDTIIRIREKRAPASFKNFYYIPASIRRFISKAQLKLDFESFLFRKNARKAIEYKIRTLKKILKRTKKTTSRRNDPEAVGLEIFNESSGLYRAAVRNYKLAPYDGEILLFYAKERYFFTDADNNIRFKKVFLNDKIRNLWLQYARSICIYDVEGDHSDMFEVMHGNSFARILQRHLASGSRESTTNNKGIKEPQPERNIAEPSLP